MSKEEIVHIIVKNLKAAIPDFAEETIDTGKSYKDLGISSLDLVEIASNTMRDMGVKLSPAELANAKNIDDLASLLVQTK